MIHSSKTDKYIYKQGTIIHAVHTVTQTITYLPFVEKL